MCTIDCLEQRNRCVRHRHTGGIFLFLFLSEGENNKTICNSGALGSCLIHLFSHEIFGTFSLSTFPTNRFIETYFIRAFLWRQDKQMNASNSFNFHAATVLTVLENFVASFIYDNLIHLHDKLFKSPFMNVHHKSMKIVIYRQLSVKSLFLGTSKFNQNNCYLHRRAPLNAYFAYVYMINSTS